MEETVIDLPDSEVVLAAPSKRPNEDSSANLDEEGNPWQRPEASTDGEPESKKRKVDVTSDSASKKRGQRMFGVLMGTLSQFKKEGKKETQSDAAKRRSAIEEKLASKLRAETEENERKSSRSRTERNLKLDVLRKEEEKYLLDSIYKKRQSAVLSMANFLCTSDGSDAAVSASASVNASIATRPQLLADLPLHAYPAQKLPPIYFLPAKLLPEQSSRLADQAVAARKAVDRDREDWADESRAREEELEEARKRRDDGLEEIAREERAERAAREREARDAEDDGEDHRAKRNGTRANEDRSPLPAMDQDPADDSRY